MQSKRSTIVENNRAFDDDDLSIVATIKKGFLFLHQRLHFTMAEEISNQPIVIDNVRFNYRVPER
jgi:hypothetical protein